jgi:hypothetical protein
MHNALLHQVACLFTILRAASCLCSLQAELKPWVDAFEQHHRRKPVLADANATGIRWLASRFASMQVLREQLLGEIPLMRSMLAKQKQQRADRPSMASNSSHTRAAVAQRPVLNSNNPSLSPKEASTRFQSALEYRRRRVEAAAKLPTPITRSTDMHEKVQEGNLLDTSSLAANLILKGGRTNERAKTALLKAIEYKQGRRQSAGKAEPRGSQNAVCMTPVEDRSIGGITYDGDASKAAPGESSFIQVGSRHVRSYRSFLTDDKPDLLAPCSQADGADHSASLASASGSACKDLHKEEGQVWSVPESRQGHRHTEQVDQSCGDDNSSHTGGSSRCQTGDVSALHGDAPVTISGTLAGRIGTSTLAALVAVAASVHSQEGAVSVLLDLRAKQAAATAAMTHAAAIAAMTDMAGAKGAKGDEPAKRKRRAKSSPDNLFLTAQPKDDKVWVAAKTARAAARTAMKEFDVARQRAKVLLHRLGHKPWVERAVASL